MESIILLAEAWEGYEPLLWAHGWQSSAALGSSGEYLGGWPCIVSMHPTR
jgi:hypothetical protein